MNPREPVLFALGSSRAFGEQVAAGLGLQLANHEEREFADGEHKARPLQSVRNRDVYVIHSLHGDAERSVNDKLVRMLFFVGAVKDAGAASATAVVPYLCYARKDRKTKPRDPVSTRYVAGLFESVGTNRIVTMDVHNRAAYQNAFRIASEHLEARASFCRHLAHELVETDVAVVSPDIGGAKRAAAFGETLGAVLSREPSMALVEKHRSEGKVTGSFFVGEVKNRTAIILDDLISSGGTLLRAAKRCREGGASRVIAVATHGAFTGGAGSVVSDPAFDSVCVTDTIHDFHLDGDVSDRCLTVIGVAPVFAEAIRRFQTGGSISDLNEA